MGAVGRALSKLNHTINQSYNISEHYVIWWEREQSIKGDKLFKGEKLANFVLQTRINIFYEGRRFESKNFIYTRAKHT